MNYEQVEEIQRSFCEELEYEYIPADAYLKVGVALETKGQLPVNGLRHSPAGGTTGWYLWGGQEFPLDDESFSPVHTHHLIQLWPEVVKFLGLPPGYRFLVADDYVDVWFDPVLLEV